MATSYKRLWKLLIDKDMKKKDLEELAGITITVDTSDCLAAIMGHSMGAGEA